MDKKLAHYSQLPHPQHVFILLLITFGLVNIIPILLETTGLLSLVSRWQLLVAEILIILPTLGFIIIRKYSFSAVFRLKKVDNRLLLLAAAMAPLLTILFEEIDRQLQYIVTMPADLAETYYEAFAVNSVSDVIFLFITVVVLAGFFEEIIFRGLLQKTLESYLDVTRAVLVSAFVFALMHGNPFAVVQIVLLGVLIGVLVWRADSVWPAIVIHAMHNLLSLVLINSKSMANLIEWHGHVNPLILFFCSFFLYLCIKVFYRFTE